MNRLGYGSFPDERKIKKNCGVFPSYTQTGLNLFKRRAGPEYLGTWGRQAG
jgi:hypothetical protein